MRSVDDENQSDSLITIGKVPDNRVKHILCLFTYLSHRIPIYRAACNIHTTNHIPWLWRVTRYAVHFTIPQTKHASSVDVAVVVIVLLMSSCTWKLNMVKNHMNVHTIIYRLFLCWCGSLYSICEYMAEKNGRRLNGKDYAQSRCCSVEK